MSKRRTHSPEFKARVAMEMQFGDILYFDGRLAHRSGSNLSNEVRYSLVGMWNDTSILDFHPPIPNFISRTKFPKDYFIELMGSERISG